MGLREVQLAALLHDIGKFEQRQGINRNHAELGSEFAGRYFSEEVASLIAQHHFAIHDIKESREEVLILKIADHISSGEREERYERDEKGDPRVEGLLSIFCKIDIGKGALPEERYYPLKPLELRREVIFPRAEHRRAQGYPQLWMSFVQEFENLGKDLETIYHLLWKYTWCVPSAVWRDVPDIALFDHLRTTCAIATCLYMQHERERIDLEALFSGVKRYWKIRESTEADAAIEEFRRRAEKDEREEFEKGRFILIGGDISGIQRFIYNIKSPQEAQKGMAKRLRGRSFYLNLLTESIAHYLLDRLSLPITNLLWCGGGHFFILAPAMLAEAVEEAEEEVNEFLIREFQGELFLVLASEQGSACDLMEFPAYLNRCRRRLGEGKKRKALNAIKSLRTLNLTRMQEEVMGTCAICGRDAPELAAEDDKPESCECCSMHEDVGAKLPRMEYLVEVVASQVPRKCDVAFNFGSRWVGWRICSKGELNLDFGVDAATSSVRVYRINSTELGIPHPGELRRDVHLGFKFYGRAVPMMPDKKVMRDRIVMSFDHLAKLSKGVERLGVVRMDVDDLGRIFSTGLKPADRAGEGRRKDNRTISRIATLSRMFDLFFTGYINNIAEEFWAAELNKARLCRDCEENLEDKKDELICAAIEAEDSGKVEYFRASDFESPLLCEDCRKDATSLIYITYSGGDDLFVVAPWDVAVEFAWRLRQEFSEYVAENPNITLSSGIFVCRERFPIGRAAQLAGEMLDDGAKELPGKDAVKVFGETVPWICRVHTEMHSDFKRLMEFGRWLEECLSENWLSRGFVYTLLSFWTETFREIDEDRGCVPYAEAKRRKRYMPRFKYLLARNVDRKKMPEVFERLDKDVPRAVPWARIPVNWALLRTRKRGGGDEHSEGPE